MQTESYFINTHESLCENDSIEIHKQLQYYMIEGFSVVISRTQPQYPLRVQFQSSTERCYPLLGTRVISVFQRPLRRGTFLGFSQFSVITWSRGRGSAVGPARNQYLRGASPLAARCRRSPVPPLSAPPRRHLASGTRLKTIRH